jgi:hypothetical protein
VSTLNSDWSGFDRDGTEPVLCGLWTAEQVARLYAVRRRYQAELLSEDTVESRRWLFYRYAVRVKGLFRG